MVIIASYRRFSSPVGYHVVEIVDLPALRRGTEWPTVALAAAIYGLWLLATFFHSDFPWWALAATGAWAVAWQQHLSMRPSTAIQRGTGASTRRSAAGLCRFGFRLRSIARATLPIIGTTTSPTRSRTR